MTRCTFFFQSPDSTSDKSQSDTDEEPAAKQRRLSPASDLSFRFGVQCGSQEIFHFYGDTAQCYVSTRWFLRAWTLSKVELGQLIVSSVSL